MSLLATSAPTLDTVADTRLWVITVLAVLGLLALDFLLTRRPHEVSFKEALGWSAFYIALPVAFGGYIVAAYGADRGLDYYTGYLVEKSLSVDNLFVFMILLGAFAVPAALQQRVLLYGIIGALLLRSVFIALGAAALSAFTWVFLVFGLVLLATGVHLFRTSKDGFGHGVDVDSMRVVRVARRLMPVTSTYEGTRLTVRRQGARHLTPLALVMLAVLATDLVFAIDSVPAVYGITSDPYLVFATNAFALLGLRALYFVLAGALQRLVHLGIGLAVVLGFIGVKLTLHWAHTQWAGVPEIPTLWSLVVIVAVLATTTVTSLRATRNDVPAEPEVPEVQRPA